MNEKKPLHPQKNASFLKRCSYAKNGIKNSIKREKSFRIQLGCAGLLLMFCLIVKPSAAWCALFATNAAFVLGLELVNSAFEAFIDLIHPSEHQEIGFVKDCLSGAVLIASIGSVISFTTFVAFRWF